jgi:hypothetical protein
MLEEVMSVWQSGFAAAPALATSEGALVSVSVTVAPRFLENLLDALAHLDFPINPQIYHDAAVRTFYADGREETEPTTIVEFPAYAGRLPEIRAILHGFDCGARDLHVGSMLDEIHTDSAPEPAPPGAPYVRRLLIRHAHHLV